MWKIPYNKPFEGINFVFASDFVQLAPAMGASSLYFGTIGTQSPDMSNILLAVIFTLFLVILFSGYQGVWKK